MPPLPTAHLRPRFGSAQDTQSDRTRILSALAAGHVSALSISRATGIERRTVYRHLQSLERIGRVVSRPKATASTGKYRLWAIAPVDASDPEPTGPLPIPRRLLAVIALGPITRDALADQLGISSAIVLLHLLALERSREIVCQPTPEGTVWALRRPRPLWEQALEQRGKRVA